MLLAGPWAINLLDMRVVEDSFATLIEFDVMRFGKVVECSYRFKSLWKLLLVAYQQWQRLLNEIHETIAGVWCLFGVKVGFRRGRPDGLSNKLKTNNNYYIK